MFPEHSSMIILPAVFPFLCTLKNCHKKKNKNTHELCNSKMQSIEMLSGSGGNQLGKVTYVCAGLAFGLFQKSGHIVLKKLLKTGKMKQEFFFCTSILDKSTPDSGLVGERFA